MLTPTLTIEDLDPQSCPNCLLDLELCPFHAGIATGWDLLVNTIAPARPGA